ncbi:MAG TPA: MFS transporter [Candidatus Dormibacteraeota bacterium]|nr:MFS transporter [Candidatus Dormibacteraeota bacterium]
MTVAAVAAAPKRRLNNLDFVLLSVYWVAIGYLWNSMGGLILPNLVQHLVGNANKGVALGTLEGIGSLMAVVWQPLVGAYSDRTRTRFGRRHPFILAGTLGDVVFLIGIALSGSYWLVLVFYFLLQTASNTAQGPYQGLLPDVVPDEQRGTGSGYYGISNVVGLFTGTVVGGYILAHAGATAAILSICVVLLATGVPTVLLVPDRSQPRRDQFAGVRHAIATTFSTPLRYPSFLWLMASRLLILMGLVGVQSFVYFYFSDVFFHHDDKATTTASYTLLGIVIVCAFLISLPAARLSDRVGRRPVILAGGLLGSAGVLFLIFSHFQLLPSGLVKPLASFLHVPELAAQATLVGILIGVGYGLFFSVDWAFIQDIIPQGEAGLFMGFSNIATAGAGIIARFVGGFLLDPFNKGPEIFGLPGGYPVIFAVFCAWLLVGALLILKVPESRRV